MSDPDKNPVHALGGGLTITAGGNYGPLRGGENNPYEEVPRCGDPAPAPLEVCCYYDKGHPGPWHGARGHRWPTDKGGE